MDAASVRNRWACWAAVIRDIRIKDSFQFLRYNSSTDTKTVILKGFRFGVPGSPISCNSSHPRQVILYPSIAATYTIATYRFQRILLKLLYYYSYMWLCRVSNDLQMYKCMIWSEHGHEIWCVNIEQVIGVCVLQLISMPVFPWMQEFPS